RSVIDRLKEAAKPGKLEIVVETFSKGLHDDREVGKLPRNLQQVLGAEPLEPERRTLGWIGPGHEQGPCRVLAKPQPEEGRVRKLLSDQLLGQLGGQAVQQIQGRVIQARDAKKQAVIAVQASHGKAEAPAYSSQQGQLQTQVQFTAQRREYSQAQLTRLV